MSKVIWGKYFWKTIHYTALGYPNDPTLKDKNDYKTFYTLLSSVLPCNICRNNFIKNLENHPIDDNVLSSRENLLKWTIDLHNIVNGELGYPILSYPDAIDQLHSNDTKDNQLISNDPTKSNNYIFIFLLLFTFILLIIYYKKYLKR